MAAYRDKRRASRPWVLDISYTDRRTGKQARYFRNAKCQTADGARAEERALLRLYAEHGYIPTDASDRTEPEEQPELTFSEAVTLFDETAAQTLKPSTLVGYRKNLKAYLEPRFGTWPLSKIDRAAVTALDQELAREGLSTSTRNNVLIPIRSVIRNAIATGRHRGTLDLPKLHKVQQKVFEPPTAQQVAAVVAAAEPNARVAIALAAYAGLRASEVIGLRWVNVNLKTKLLFVREAITHGEVVLPKSGHQRAVPIAPALQEILEVAAKRPHDPTAPVSSPGDGRPWSSRGLSAAFLRALRKANVPHARLHDLRHFFITECFAAGAGGPTVQRLAGHCHLSVTQRYAHTNDDLMRRAVEVFGRRSA